MAEKGENKNLIIITICIILISIGFNGCVENEKDNNKKNNDIYFLLSYSRDSDIEVNISVIIITNKHEVYNETSQPKKGYEIYREKASGNDYLVKANWNNETTQIRFKPQGYNSLLLRIKNNEIKLMELTE
jgi:hypothetical protein